MFPWSIRTSNSKAVVANHLGTVRNRRDQKHQKSPVVLLKKSGEHQLKLVLYTITYKALYIAGGAGFFPSTNINSIYWSCQICLKKTTSPWTVLPCDRNHCNGSHNMTRCKISTINTSHVDPNIEVQIPSTWPYVCTYLHSLSRSLSFPSERCWCQSHASERCFFFQMKVSYE